MRKDYENYIDVYLKEVVQICGMINKEHIADLAQKINKMMVVFSFLASEGVPPTLPMQ